MKKHHILIITAFFLFIGCAYSQNRDYKKLVDDFKKCKNDSVFISKNSITPFSKFEQEMPDSSQELNPIQIEVFHADLNQVLGPYKTDSSVYFLKVTGIDTGYYQSVGNIWLDIHRGREACINLANEIYEKVKSGMDYNIFCMMYSDDHSKNENCKIGPTFNDIYVEPFKSEITKHKLNDVFIVETKFGFHVVKMLSTPFRTRSYVYCVKLELSEK